MAEDRRTPLSDADFELLLLLVDGELSGPEKARAEALVASHADARAFVQDWHLCKDVLREAVLETAPAQADLSRVRGHVMTKLPAEPRPLVQETGLWAALRRLGFGKVSFAVGAAVAAALWLIATSTGHRPQTPAPSGAIAAHTPRPTTPGDEEPGVIIEDTDVEDGALMVHHGEHTGDATIIWHYQPAASGKGEG